ncbi:hypothetical protein [uncultured Tenacibaculum sp.]|uniref:hypothetical protein n=1 Tax=uncultured Tenacibaculum sp. TaxID=174713 RepID=UPI002603330B|nr:hypothetical protein [uncultured Tenacibaculum sp.]
MNKEAKKYYYGLVIFLLFLIGAIGVLSYQNARDYSRLKDVFEDEKKELESNLGDVIKDYEKALSGNRHLSYKINEELEKLISLRDSVSNLKETNYGLIRHFRNRINELEKTNRELFVQIDSLYAENSVLNEENLGVKKILSEKENQNSLLKRKNRYLRATKEDLEEKIATAVVIETTPIKVVAMKKRNSGKHVSTSRSSKTDAFKVYFNLLENKIVDSGLVPICVQVIDENNNIISSKGKTKMKDGSRVQYSDAFLAEYFNKEINVLSFISVNRDTIKKGIYTIKVYVNEMYSGETKLKLK